MPDDRNRSAEERLDALEASHLQQLAELRALRADLRRETSSARPAPPPTSQAPRAPAAPTGPPPRQAPRATGLNFEQLIGRYGTIAIATLAILLGVGAFLQWAIARGLLGPEVRVLLGALVAVALAALGLHLRRRGTERFGDVLLAIALAVVHLDAWGAGPGLSLIPNWAALGIAAVASGALAAFAVAEDEEILFALGVGGALAAPFVANWSGIGPAALLTYGWIVLSAAMLALTDTTWVQARRILAVATGIYVAAGAARVPRIATPDIARLPALFALAVAMTATAIGHVTHRRSFARPALAYMALALVAVAYRGEHELQLASMAFVGLLAVQVLRLRDATVAAGSGRVVEALVLPVAFQLVATLAFRSPTTTEVVGVAVAWVLVAIVVARVVREAERGPYVAGALAAILIGIIAATRDNEVWLAVLAAGVNIATLRAMVEFRSRSLIAPLVLGLAVTTLAAADVVDRRVDFDYVPLLTAASLAMFAAAASWVGTSRLIPAPYGGRGIGITAILIWGHLEFVDAFSEDIATFLLISYYAVFGVVLIGIGRARAAAAYRHAGLALALFAAGKAVAQASDLSNIGLRVASYLIVGAFLLGVGYWYRAGAEGSALSR